MKVYRLVPLISVCFLLGCTTAPHKPAPGANLPECGLLPNCVNSESGQAGSAVAPLHATVLQWQQLKQWIMSQDDWAITEDTGDFVQAVVTTPQMRFRDDVQLQFVQATGVIEVRSSSRLGISDMGTNRRRVELLRKQIEYRNGDTAK
jgi:uncharacterized protein (DUF1499 family)